jgi:MGT family glycosyltransferase
VQGPLVRVRLAVATADATTGEGPPPWTVTRPGRPAVYVTLGTVFNLESGDLFERVLAAAADHDGDVLVTVGRDLDPALLGPQPANVHVERFVPQAAVLPHVAAVLSHAGSGSVLGALAHGLPMVLLPMGADQPWNGDRCAALGVARVLDPVTATAGDIAAALREVVGDPSYATAAMAQRDALAALPGPDAAVAAIAGLAAGQPG